MILVQEGQENPENMSLIIDSRLVIRSDLFLMMEQPNLWWHSQPHRLGVQNTCWDEKMIIDYRSPSLSISLLRGLTGWLTVLSGSRVEREDQDLNQYPPLPPHLRLPLTSPQQCDNVRLKWSLSLMAEVKLINGLFCFNYDFFNFSKFFNNGHIYNVLSLIEVKILIWMRTRLSCYWVGLTQCTVSVSKHC